MTVVSVEVDVAASVTVDVSKKVSVVLAGSGSRVVTVVCDVVDVAVDVGCSAVVTVVRVAVTVDKTVVYVIEVHVTRRLLTIDLWLDKSSLDS